ncbi:glycosyltransferase [Sphingobium sp. Cam5-1]|uniref:glycosyltransferase n=1 Tax=Sphingobium sp. Cam5-1 TaxID=2789327 RepID=UPI0018AD26F4|nr:nucleotide disphospho-sugar-binding domain-containing protein [Sphingobium sp. Cam5-1]QPI73404.1 hypothetical protein IZV00_02585 [Sphingobium sp. Cam5-1]QPI75539.1 hypothetical protein IZV00_18995 [Sphingobium sp. Cam5-1]QPI75710.1 hypothetical protein IZV00_20315 [Sphingobium sp. Cam5-1]
MQFADFRAELDDGRLSIVQAPIFLHRSPSIGKISSLAEILAQIGFADPQLLGPVVRAWERLIGKVQPSVILSDAAPSLNIAASGRLPVIVIGNGWTVPPDRAELPPLLATGDASQIKLASAHILDAVERVAKRNIVHFPALLRGVANYICTLKMLDPYNFCRDEALHWSPEIEPPSKDAVPSRDMVLIYLPMKHPAIQPLIKVAHAVPMQQYAYFGGARYPETGNLQVSPTPIDFRAEVPGCRLIVHHGGLGTALQALVQGVPQIICPADLEKSLIATAISASGAGAVLTFPISSQNVATAIQRALACPSQPPSLSELVTRSPQETLTSLLSTSNGLR